MDWTRLTAKKNATRAYLIGAVLIVVIAFLDWRIVPNISLGFLYFIPMLIMAPFLPWWGILLIGAACSYLRELFGNFTPGWPEIARLFNVWLAISSTGMLVRQLVWFRGKELRYLHDLSDQERLRLAAENELKTLVESSPAGIFIVDENREVLIANEATQQILGVQGHALAGARMDRYLPVLTSVMGSQQQFMRTAVECRGQRESGEVFLAHIWFSAYSTPRGMHLAAIMLDASEDLRAREELGLDRMLANSRVLVGAVSHELRNLCAGIAVLHSNLTRVPGLGDNVDFQALSSMVDGLRKLASAELRPRSDDAERTADLGAALADLRIVIEPLLRESNVELRWQVPPQLALVRADQEQLLQVLFNLVSNAQRAAERGAGPPWVKVMAEESPGAVSVRVLDSGPGPQNPAVLFQPFQHGADVIGLGLYVARAIVRAFAGDLRYAPEPEGTCFIVELMRA